MSNIIEKLGITRRSVYLSLLDGHEYQDNPMSWHFWKFYVWPTYKKMLEEWIREWDFIEVFLNLEADNILPASFIMLSERQNIIKNLIEKATGKSWEEIKELL